MTLLRDLRNTSLVAVSLGTATTSLLVLASFALDTPGMVFAIIGWVGAALIRGVVDTNSLAVWFAANAVFWSIAWLPVAMLIPVWQHTGRLRESLSRWMTLAGEGGTPAAREI